MASAVSKKSSASSLQGEISRLRTVVTKAEESFSRAHQVRRLLAISFLRGAISALGAIATVVIVLPIFVSLLRSVEWPPLIAGAISNVILQIEQSSPPLQPRAVDQ